MNQDAIQDGQAEANGRGRSRALAVALRVVAEAVLIVLIAGFAYRCLRWPPREAANMPQDSGKYAVAAWNLYDTGRYELTINNRGYPSWGGLGYGFLIVPSFWFFGPYLGNAIYTQTALAVLLCVVIYFSVRMSLGLLPAVIAALTLPLYPDFRENARLNDTDLPAAFFLALGLLVFLWILRDPRSRSSKWLLWGLCAGWGTAVRTSTVPAFAALTVTLVCVSPRRVGEMARNLVAAALGSLPIMIPLLLYNRHYCGSCFRDAHAFWESYDYDHLSRFFGLRYAFGSPTFYTEDFNHAGHLVFYGREVLSQFSSWPAFVADQRFLVRELTCFLTGLMVVGVVSVCRRARSNRAARHLLWYAIVASGTTLLFYVVTKFASTRYFVPVIPFAAIFPATAVVDVTRWLGRRPLLRVLVPVFLILSGATPYRWLKTGRFLTGGELVPKSQVLEGVSAGIESNAVVVGLEYWELINHIVIRGTSRQFVPLNDKSYFRVQPTPPARRTKTGLSYTEWNNPDRLEDGAIELFDYSATEDPGRIQELLARGLPVYVLDFSFDTFYNEQSYRALRKRFNLIGWQGTTIVRSPKKELEGTTFTVLWKVEPRTVPFLVR